MPTAEDWLKNPQRPKPAPIEYSGKWVAWDKGRQNVLASGATFAEALDSALSAGYESNQVILYKVPRADAFFVG